jgi:integrase
MSAAKVIGIQEAKRDIRTRRSDGEGRITPQGKSWRFEVCIDGVRYSKSFKMAKFASVKDKNDAFAAWRKGIREKASAGDITTVGDLLRKFVALQVRDNKAGASQVAFMVEAHLIPGLGDVDARDPNLLAKVEAYRDKRMLEATFRGTLTRNATINNEISYLKSALKLLRPEPRLLLLKKLDTSDGIRRGLISPDEYYQLLTEVEPYQQAVWCFAYYTGVRQGQLLKLRREWGIEALQTGVMEIPGWYQFPNGGRMRITKNGEPHFIPIYNEHMKVFLHDVIRYGDPECPFLFQKNRKRIKQQTYYTTFRRIKERLGLGHINFHDTRRTAVTNMIDAGIPPEDAMAVSGHLDPRMLKRYNIITNAKKRASAKKVGERMGVWHQEQSKSVAKSAKLYANITPGAEAATGGEARKPN